MHRSTPSTASQEQQTIESRHTRLASFEFKMHCEGQDARLLGARPCQSHLRLTSLRYHIAISFGKLCLMVMVMVMTLTVCCAVLCYAVLQLFLYILQMYMSIFSHHLTDSQMSMSQHALTSPGCLQLHRAPADIPR